jgi:glutathione S-transferase
MDIALYYSPNACSLVPYVTLTEAKAAFEVRPLNFRRREHFSSDYLTINPRHKVPALVVDDRTLTENVAIQVWIARTFPTPRCFPPIRGRK